MITQEEIAHLPIRMLMSMIDHPRELQAEYRSLPGDRIEIRLTPNINDQGIAVGKQGAHIKALRNLGVRIGARMGLQIVVMLFQNEEGERLPEKLRVPAGPTYSCTEHKQLLYELLGAILGQAPDIVVERDQPAGIKPAFAFRVMPKSRQDDAMLIDSEGMEGGQSLLADLNLLFKAAGNRDGVSYRIEAV
jgi:predicted RNA-binding protein YlqC (UPF0109 family)